MIPWRWNPNNSLIEGQNVVTLVGQQGVLDVSLVDHIRVNYRHTYTADGNALKFKATANQLVTVGSFTTPDIRVLDVTNASVPSLVGATVDRQERVLCLHLLRHGAFRPLWLCDVAVAVETRSPEFDWDLWLSTDKRVADWIACTIGLAHQLLGAQVDDTPVADRAKNLPSWLVPTVLKLWEKPFAMDHGIAKHRAPMSKYLRDPRGLLADLRNRWPDPISATVYTKGPFNELPRWPFQIGECVSRTARFLARLPKALRES